MYRRRRTLFEHQDVACTTLGFQPLTEAQRRALVRVLRDELSRTTDRQRLLGFARRWLYEHRRLVPRERDLRMLIRKAVRSHEAVLARSILDTVEPHLLVEWYGTLTGPRPDGITTQTWLWAAPAKHSTRQIDSLLERIDCLYRLGVDRQLADLPNAILRRYARRLGQPAAGRGGAQGRPVPLARAEPAQQVEVGQPGRARPRRHQQGAQAEAEDHDDENGRVARARYHGARHQHHRHEHQQGQPDRTG